MLCCVSTAKLGINGTQPGWFILKQAIKESFLLGLRHVICTFFIFCTFVHLYYFLEELEEPTVVATALPLLLLVCKIYHLRLTLTLCTRKMASKLRCTDRDAANYGRMFWFKGTFIGRGGDVLWRG